MENFYSSHSVDTKRFTRTKPRGIQLACSEFLEVRCSAPRIQNAAVKEARRIPRNRRAAQSASHSQSRLPVRLRGKLADNYSAISRSRSVLYLMKPNTCDKALLLLLKIQKDRSDSKDFLFGEFRIDRERECVLTQPFGNREIARPVTEMRVDLL